MTAPATMRPLFRIRRAFAIDDRVVVLAGTDELGDAEAPEPARAAGQPARVVTAAGHAIEGRIVELRVEHHGGRRAHVAVHVEGLGTAGGLDGATLYVPAAVIGGAAPPPPVAATGPLVEIAAADAAARGLPAVGIAFDRRGTAMSATVFPEAGCLVRCSGPPGGTLLFEVHVAPPALAADAVARAVTARVARGNHVATVVARGQVALAGAPRDALVVSVPRTRLGEAWVAASVPTSAATLLVLAGVGAPAHGTPTLDQILAHPDLAPLWRTLTIDDPGARAPRTLSQGGAIGVDEPGFAGDDGRTWAPRILALRDWERELAARASLPRALGALLGMAVGDALGTTNEFSTMSAPPFPAHATGPVTDIVGGGPFRLVAGQVTDDTQMALAIADIFTRSTAWSPGQVAARYLAWADVAFDIGAQTRQALDLVARGAGVERAGRLVWEERERRPAGNGSLMRTAVLGVLLAAVPPDERRRAIFAESAITHFDPRCQLACAAYDAAIARALTGRATPSAMARAAANELGDAAAALRALHPDLVAEIDAAEAGLRADLDAAREDDPDLYGRELHLHHTSGFVRVAFRLAFWELLHAPDLPTAVIDAANRGGDADTNAAIVGALLGAFYGVEGIPSAWIDRVLAAPGLEARDLDAHPRGFLAALARGWAAHRDDRVIATLAPYVARGVPGHGGVAPVAASGALGPWSIEAWLTGGRGGGQALVADPAGARFVATVLPDHAEPVAVEPMPDGVSLATPAYRLRPAHAAPVLADLLRAVVAAEARGAPLGHLGPELVYVRGDGDALRVVAVLADGDAHALARARAARLAWIPRSMLCAAPELLAGAPPTSASGVFSACALYLFLITRHGPYARDGGAPTLAVDDVDLARIREPAVKDVVRAGLQADPGLRPPARMLVERLTAAAPK